MPVSPPALSASSTDPTADNSIGASDLAANATIRRVGGIILIVALATLVYLPSIHGGFILDDDIYLTNEPLVKASDGLFRFWFSTDAIDYYPVSNSTLWLEWRLWHSNPTGYHVTNLAIHIANSLLIWLVLRRLAIPGAFLAALVFAIHPFNVESVAWIAQRKNLLAMFFFLLSVLWYLKTDKYKAATAGRASRQPTTDHRPLTTRLPNRWYWLSLLAFVFAMLSKGAVAFAPLTLLLIVWWQHGRLSRSDLLQSVPFFLVAGFLAAVNVYYQTHDATIRIASPAQRLTGAGAATWFYVAKSLCPTNLIFIYPAWDIQVKDPRWWLPLVAVIAVTLGLFLYRKTTVGRSLFFAWMFFCLALTPVMGFVDVGYMQYTLVADHYVYFALVALIALVTAAGAILIRIHRTILWPTVAIATASVLALTVLSWRQNSIYRDAITLYEDVLLKNSDCWLAHSNLGGELVKVHRIADAEAHFQLALSLKPDDAVSFYNLGAAANANGKYDDSLKYLNRAIQIRPDYAEAYNNLGSTLLLMGRPQEAIPKLEKALQLNPALHQAEFNIAEAQIGLGKISEAIPHYRKALKIEPDDAETHYSFAMALAKTGKTDDAIAELRDAIKWKSDYAQAYNNLGVVLASVGKFQDAIPEFEHAIRIKPQYAEAKNNLGEALKRLNRLPEAIAQYKQALADNAEYVPAHVNLGLALMSLDKPDEAVEHFQEAVRLKPKTAEVYLDLGMALSKSNRPKEAAENLRRALELKPDSAEAHAELAKALAKLDQQDEAIANAEQALQLAQAKGNAAIAHAVEEWLKDYRASSKNAPNPTPPTTGTKQ